MNAEFEIRGKTMKQITRNEAEKLINKTNVISTDVEQDKKEMRIIMQLADNNSFLVKYDILGKTKSYFLECMAV